ncbi:MAG: hypothetical protein ABIN89_29795 [Chitinophagaceae bacterium]
MHDIILKGISTSLTHRCDKMMLCHSFKGITVAISSAVIVTPGTDI